MWEWVEKNKEWIFSGAGLTLAGLLVWAGKSAFHRLKRLRPHVKLNLAIATLRTGRSIKALTISLLNPTDREIVVGNFVLELTTGETLYLPHDCYTGELQQKRIVKRCDEHSFHIGIDSLRNMGRTLSDFKCALVQTPAGSGYRSTRKELHRFLRNILKEPPDS
jgi:hypothetical protein